MKGKMKSAVRRLIIKIRQCGVVSVCLGAIIGITVLCAFLTTLIHSEYNEEKVTTMSYDSEPFQPPGRNLLGTDGMGRDVFKLLVVGSRSFFVPSLVAAGIALVLGALSGTFSGYYDGKGVINRLVFPVATALESIPRWVVIVVVCSISKSSIYGVMLALGLMNFPKVANLIRGRILQLKEEQFVEAAKELGLSDFTIMWRHLLRKNCKYILFGQGMHGMADAILVEATVRYLFYSIGAKVSWGQMAVDGAEFFFINAPFEDVHPYWVWLFPAAMIVLTIAGFYILGDVLTKWYEVGREGNPII